MKLTVFISSVFRRVKLTNYKEMSGHLTARLVSVPIQVFRSLTLLAGEGENEQVL